MKLRVFGIRIPLLILGLFLSLGCSGDSAGDTSMGATAWHRDTISLNLEVALDLGPAGQSVRVE